MAPQASLWLIWMAIIFFLQHNAECRSYDRCLTRDGRPGICVAKRFCREAAASPRQVLTACAREDGSHCCPVPTTRSAETPGASDHAPVDLPNRPKPSSTDSSNRQNNGHPETSEKRYRPGEEFGGSSHSSSSSSSSSSSEGIYRQPERNDRPAGSRNKQTGDNGASRHVYGDAGVDEKERKTTVSPRHDDRNRQREIDFTTRRSTQQRSTPSPSRNNDRSPPQRHLVPDGPIKLPEVHETRHPSTSACGRKPYELLIAGGEESREHEWPWMTAIFRNSPKPNTYICGGSLINNRYILSAAHCFIKNYVILPASAFMVRLGAHYLDSGEDYSISDLMIHPNHNGSDYVNDIALIRLAGKVFFTDKIAPICLPSDEVRFNNFVGRMATVAGWGATEYYRVTDSRVLQHVTVPVLPNEDCSSAYSRVRGAAFLARGTDSIICAGLKEGGKDACLGDSGSPLMLKTNDDSWTVIGIVSLGYKCAEPGYPGVYTRVTHYLTWIYSTMKNF